MAAKQVMRALAMTGFVVGCGAASAPAPVSATEVVRVPVREDPRRILVERTFAAIAANDRKALVELADADNLVDRLFACDNAAQARRTAVRVRFDLARLARLLGGQTLEVVEVPGPTEHRSRTVRRRGERADGCEHKLAAAYEEFDVWVRIAGERELRMRMNVVKVDGQLYLHGAPRVVRVEGPADLALVDQLEAIADRMCGCPDSACAEQVERDLRLWVHAQTKAAGDEIVDASPESASRQAELTKRYAACDTRRP